MRTSCTVFSNLKLFQNKKFYFLKREFFKDEKSKTKGEERWGDRVDGGNDEMAEDKVGGSVGFSL